MVTHYPVENLKKRAVLINEESSISSKLLAIPIQYQKYIEKVLVPSGFIIDRIEAMALQILLENNDGDITFLVMLKGAVTYSHYLQKFVSDIKKHINFKGSVYFEYVSSSSYSDTQSTGQLKISTSEEIFKRLAGKSIVIVEDMYDSGKSLNLMLKYLEQFHIKSIKISTLFVKLNPENLQYNLHIDYIGFVIPGDAFLVGFGLDYNDCFRDLNHACVVSETGLALLKSK